MAAKRFMEEQISGGSDVDDHHHHHQPSVKRIRSSTSIRPSLTSVIGEALMMNSMHNFCKAMEPMIRRVVSSGEYRNPTSEIDFTPASREEILTIFTKISETEPFNFQEIEPPLVNEEVEGTLQKLSTRARPFNRSPSLRIQAPIPSPSSLQLIFRRNLALPIFTGSKVVDSQGDPLQILLVETMSGGQTVQTSLPHPIKVEIVVLDGDFPSYDENNWTTETFDSKILKERTGKRPLLAGDCLTVILRDGIASIGEIEFTDNSSWIRGRKFRIGARVVLASSQGLRIREAITDAFVVKDHRGELYKKHHPPMLNDEVWRLEKIGKDGAFHKKLSSHNINSVQDFLKFSIVDPPKLRRILGAGMSDKMWGVTIKHARKCVMGNKHYVMVGHNYSVTFNPICQLVNATINGQLYSTRDLPCINRGYIESLVRQAYANWSSLQEVIAVSSDFGLLTQGEEEYQNSELKERIIGKANDQIESGQMGNMMMNWENGVAVSPAGIHYSISGSSSDGNFTPTSSSYIGGGDI